VGNKYFLTEKLRSRMQVRPAARFESRGRFSQALLSSDIRRLEDLYRANGFEQVKITSKIIDDYQGHENDLALMISVDEGPQTLVGTFHIQGNNSSFDAHFGPNTNTADRDP